MKVLLLISLFILCFWSPRDFLAKFNWTSKKEYVYICESRTSVAYHASRDCKGLHHCTHEIFRTTTDSARNYYEKRACKLCE